MKYYLIFIVLFFSQNIESQNNCICCAYHSIEFADSYDAFFNPQIISENRIKKAIIRTEGKNGLEKFEYKQAEFQFDEKGRIKGRIVFHEGHYSLKVSYERNTKGQIAKTTESYLDSVGNIDDRMLQKIEDYKYDNQSNLIMIKERNYRGEIIDDKLSKFTRYEYDSLNRIVRTYRYSYNDESSIYIDDETIKFLNTNESNSLTLNNGKPSIESIVKYNNGRVISQLDFNLPNKKLSMEQYYKYDNNNQLLSYTCITGIESDQCNDIISNFSESYQYNKNLLIEKITYKLGNTTCEMFVKYE